jgi:hypothetical protein
VPVCERAGLLVRCRSVGELGSLLVRCRSVGEKWFPARNGGPVPVCERAGREMVRCRSVRALGGDGLLVSRETKRGENFWGEMVLVPETRDIGFKFFLIKCHCHLGKWLMKDGQKAPL